MFTTASIQIIRTVRHPALLCHFFLHESALVEFVRPMKVDQLCVMVKLVKGSTSTSVILEATHNYI